MVLDNQDFSAPIQITGSSVTLNVSIQSSAVTLNVNIASSAVTLNVAIQSSAVTLNVNLTSSSITLNVNIASSAATINVSLTASSVTINISITAQTIGVQDIGEYALQQSGTGLYFQANFANQAQNTQINTITLTAPAAQTFNLVGVAGGSIPQGSTGTYCRIDVQLNGTIEASFFDLVGTEHNFQIPFVVPFNGVLKIFITYGTNAVGAFTISSSIWGYYK